MLPFKYLHKKGGAQSISLVSILFIRWSDTVASETPLPVLDYYTIKVCSIITIFKWSLISIFSTTAGSLLHLPV